MPISYSSLDYDFTRSIYAPGKEAKLTKNLANNIQGSSQLSPNPDDGVDSGTSLTGRKPYSLFYNGAKNDGNYGYFWNYSIGKTDNIKVAIDKYINSEKMGSGGRVNQSVSSIKSRNPSAQRLVKGDGVIGNRISKTGVTFKSAPYELSDFLYTKHYGIIPNNYLLTLRRYPHAVTDNLSTPRQVKGNPDLVKGVGQPSAQAVTWMGGDSGNSLSKILSFSTGIKWKMLSQEDVVHIKNPGGILSGVLGGDLNTITDRAGITGKSGFFENLFSTLRGSDMENMVGIVSEDGYKDARVAYELRDRAMQEGSPLSNFAWSGYDTIYETHIRDRGLKFGMENLEISFHYQLSSVSYLNSKVAMLDIMSNLMALGSNMGEFASPYLMFDKDFPPALLAFPGGQAGLLEYYRNPSGYLLKNGPIITDKIIKEADKLKNRVKSVLEDYNKGLRGAADSAIGFSQLTNMDKNLANIQMNLSVLSGAPIGEWHLVVGNPMNPIAMIGNLICDNVSFKFGDRLGPDDFPTELVATFSLKHARPREPGEIQSMFNRGQGRMYTTPKAPSSYFTSSAFSGPDGTQFTSLSGEGIQSEMLRGNSSLQYNYPNE
jgi:hypothetical protein